MAASNLDAAICIFYYLCNIRIKARHYNYAKQIDTFFAFGIAVKHDKHFGLFCQISSFVFVRFAQKMKNSK
jgi:hypothetical protein